MSADLRCTPLTQAVKNGTHFASKERFDMQWNVKNTGTAQWNSSSDDFTYIGGTKMYASALNHLRTSVMPGETVALVADMVAPKGDGTFTTIWGLRRGTNVFCRVSLTINVP